MAKLVEMDENVSLSNQMEKETGPVILIARFNVDPADVDQFLNAWTTGATILKQQSGFISAQGYRWQWYIRCLCSLGVCCTL
jgi:hypothetical protein